MSTSKPGKIVGQASCLSVGVLGNSDVIEYYEQASATVEPRWPRV